jgi:hypothetical protein
MGSKSSALTREQVLNAVRSWPAEERFWLAYEILHTLGREEPTPEQRRDAFRHLRGTLKTSDPPPTDEDVKRWLDEYRVSKYG